MQNGENFGKIDSNTGNSGWEEVAALGGSTQDITNDSFQDILNSPLQDTPGDESPEFYDDYDDEYESPEMRQYFENYDQIQEILPDFEADVAQLIRQVDTNTTSPSNNLFTSATYLPILAQMTADSTIRFELFDAISKVVLDYQKHHHPHYMEDEDLSDDEIAYQVASELLDTSLDNLVEWRSSNQISEETMQTGLQALSNIHKTIPLEPNPANFYNFSGFTHQDYLRQQKYQNCGIIDQNFLDQLQNHAIARVFTNENLPVPDSLQSLSPEAHQFWNTQSEKLGFDALQKYTRQLTFRSLYAQPNGDNPASATDPAIFFTSDGMPTTAAFASHGPILNSLNIASRHDQQDNLNFVQAFAEYLPPKEAFLFDGILKLQDRPKIADRFTRLLVDRGNHQASLFDAANQPTQEFWDLVNLNPDLSVIKAFAGYEQHFSPERLAAANLNPEQREALHNFLYTSNPNYEDAIDFIDDVLTTDGKLSDYFFEYQPILGKLPAENLASGFPEQLPEHFSPDQINYL